MIGEAQNLLEDNITPQQETLIFEEIEEESRDIITDFSNLRRFQQHSPFLRRFSAPVTQKRDIGKFDRFFISISFIL